MSKEIPFFFRGDNDKENREIFLILKGSSIKFTDFGKSDTGKPILMVGYTKHYGADEIKKWVEKIKEDP